MDFSEIRTRAQQCIARHKYLVIAGALIIIYGIFLVATHPTQTLPADILQIRADDHVLGSRENPKGILIEYSDFECPACGVYHSLLKQIVTDTNGEIALVYRHYPLSAIHPDAETASRAAEAAALQGKFFEMHDLLFTEQAVWSKSDDPVALFVSYAEKIGLDRERFLHDMDSSVVHERVIRNKEEAEILNLRGTPSFFLNGTAFPLARTYPEFKTALINAVY